ncbi:hypothetical protein GT347_10790 [Xylophilus rhododendri]|uniref:Uncharacterized protein n=1 Tax=Xylophilus rhododendri TaxID=2697032 RepID=A0A857J6L6_9BURK|nr:hypothetical protein [Xylophilus rhododendri]QHI98438.1 hypothetical protein GT347_10790 [Xylophilus rhododendri]
MHQPKHTHETPAEHLADLPVEPEMPQGDIPPEQPEDVATGVPAAPAAPK